MENLGQQEPNALICSPNEEDQVKFLSAIIASNEKVSAGLMGHYKTHFDKFQSGDHEDDFCFVIFSLLDQYEAESVDMQEDMYRWYGAAPVCAWVLDSDLAREKSVKKLVNAGHRVFTY